MVFAGEFGRTVFGQGNIARDNYGRDHHPRCFSGWLAGGGIKSGIHYGKTDDFSYNVVEDPVNVRDLHATTASPPRGRPPPTDLSFPGTGSAPHRRGKIAGHPGDYFLILDRIGRTAPHL